MKISEVFIFFALTRASRKFDYFLPTETAVETDNLEHTSNLICSLDADIVFCVTGSWQILYINCCGSLNEPETCVLLLKGAHAIT